MENNEKQTCAKKSEGYEKKRKIRPQKSFEGAKGCIRPLPYLS